ncbi:iron-containing alcohol dehydrogenase [Aliiglaciecola sp. 3_MG-2023]|uniref:iron-containing alcohol dehydrogenase n=1 Tax=Aliiglaciecola sp. 3_MG-2023 TaxID=3062644 RepID=UPI0026E13188|nr:iron-containing alcohol dehydrogenase [Aliiglaciecola sp. 3_MG-2023]MDO6694813.1 iron-containing alcohol dehydrogenase [Aliiglaciecola sp. 3_MG-2023]
MQISSFKSAHTLITGHGCSSELIEHIKSLNINYPLIVTDKGVRKSGTLELITAQLETMPFSIFDDVNAEPDNEVVEHCFEVYNCKPHDSIISVGGGSAIDIAKCVAMLAGNSQSLNAMFGENKVINRGVPHIAIPTTAGTGSEVTNIAILAVPREQTKKGVVSNYLLPDVAIVAPEMTLSCPPHVTAASGVDALVHAIEAYLSKFASPITDALAIKAMNMIMRHLPTAYEAPQDLDARENMATASLMAGLAFGNAGVGAVHALAYPLGGRYHISHGVSNALMLPYVMQWNKSACLARFVDMANALSTPVSPENNADFVANKVIQQLHNLCAQVGIPKGLHSLGINKEDIPELAQEAIKVERLLKNNPRKLSLSDIESIYYAAY